VPNVGYIFQTSTHMSDWTETPITASSLGLLEMTVPISSGEPQRFYRFAYRP